MKNAANSFRAKKITQSQEIEIKTVQARKESESITK